MCVSEPTVWALLGHLLSNHIANDVQLVLQPGSNKQKIVYTLDHFPAFSQDVFLQLLTYFSVFLKCFSDNRGRVWPQFLIVIYEVQKSRDFHFYIDSAPSATRQKKCAAAALEWKQLLHNLIAWWYHSLTFAVCVCQFTEIFPSRSKSNGVCCV